MGLPEHPPPPGSPQLGLEAIAAGPLVLEAAAQLGQQLLARRDGLLGRALGRLHVGHGDGAGGLDVPLGRMGSLPPSLDLGPHLRQLGL